MVTLIMTATLNDIDPRAWFVDVLASIADMPVTCPYLDDCRQNFRLLRSRL
jgi:hypothetical protein